MMKIPYIGALALFSVAAYAGYSQFGQDQFVKDNFFTDKKDGIFVDIGAHDGKTINNTLMFEQSGWKGICIEPMELIFEKLIRNRSCICIQGCISDTAGVQEFFHVISGNLHVEMLSGLASKYTKEHRRRVERELERTGGKLEVIIVQCYLLHAILDEHHMDHIDYLSIDTEGGELDILKTIDFSKVPITVIDVENNNPNDRSIQIFLENKGYMYIKRLGVDEIYYRNISL
jgi:FkbM family methyltransferase